MRQAHVSEVKARGTGFGGALWRCTPQLPAPRATASKNCLRSLTERVGGACRSWSEAALLGVVSDGALSIRANCSLLRARLLDVVRDIDSNNALRSRTGTYLATASCTFGEHDLARFSIDAVLRLAASIAYRPLSAPPTVPSHLFKYLRPCSDSERAARGNVWCCCVPALSLLQLSHLMTSAIRTGASTTSVVFKASRDRVKSRLRSDEES